MRIKRCIALLMLAVYLFAVGTPVVAALTCQCAAMKVRTEHRCCSHCNHDLSVTQGRVHFEAPCCGDQHSTEIELYVASSQDGERFVKRVFVSELPPAILAEPIASVDYAPVLCGYVACEGISAVPAVPVSSCGLRAPPALV